MALEKEVKILNIDVNDAEKRLQTMGAILKFKTKQQIYTYDLPGIYSRFCDIIYAFKTGNMLLIDTNKKKLENLFVEVEDLVSDEELNTIFAEFNISSLNDILDKTNYLEIFESQKFNATISKLGINPNKWVRLREQKGKTTLTTKNVFDKVRQDGIQKVLENEIEVKDIEETNQTLNALGFVRRNFQEKIRTQYAYDGAEIDIDEWPKLEPYIEIESENIDLIQEIIKKLGYTDKEIVSVNTEVLYRQKGIEIKNLPELRFEW